MSFVRIFNCLGIDAQDDSYIQIAEGNAVVIDLNGDDTYAGAPLGLATGRLGVGLLIDHDDGDDEHHAARYGHGASAHYGVGLFIDRQGDDRYGSSGPFYRFISSPSG